MLPTGKVISDLAKTKFDKKIPIQISDYLPCPLESEIFGCRNRHRKLFFNRFIREIQELLYIPRNKISF